jgi:hypothetical protein
VLGTPGSVGASAREYVSESCRGGCFIPPRAAPCPTTTPHRTTPHHTAAHHCVAPCHVAPRVFGCMPGLSLGAVPPSGAVTPPGALPLAHPAISLIPPAAPESPDQAASRLSAQPSPRAPTVSRAVSEARLRRTLFPAHLKLTDCSIMFAPRRSLIADRSPDVHATSDGVVLMFHDPTLDRTTTGTGLIRDQPWKGSIE